MDSRLSKQIFYGAGYLATLFLIIFIVYFIWFKPAPTCFDGIQNQNETGVDCGGFCSACEIRTLKLPETSWIKYFPIDNKTAVVAEIKNSNLNWAADSFDYFIDFYDKNNNKIKSLKNKSFIYAGEIKYLFELTDINSKNIGEVKFSFDNLNWKPEETFKRPLIQLREPTIENTVLSEFLKNNNAFKLSKIKIIGLPYNQYGILLGASKTELENMPAFEEKQFKINFPKNIVGIDINKTKVYVEAIR